MIVVTQTKMSKSQARRRKAFKRRLQIFAILAVLLGIAAFIFFAPFFNISGVVVVRSDVYSDYKISDDEIIAASGIQIGKNIFATNITNAEKAIMSIPYAKSADVRRVFPNKIKITFGEAQSAAYVKCDGGYALISMDGRILELAENPDDYAAARLEGFEVVDAKVGEQIPTDGNPVFAAALNLMELLYENDLLGKTASIDTSDLNNMEVMLGDRMQILLGDDDDMDYRIKFIKKVIDEKLSPYESVTLDYRAADLSVRSYKPEEKPTADPDSSEDPDSTENPDGSENPDSTASPDSGDKGGSEGGGE